MTKGSAFFRMLERFASPPGEDRPAILYQGEDGPVTMSYRAFLSACLEYERELNAGGDGRRSPRECAAFLIDDGAWTLVPRLFGTVMAGRQAVLLDGNAPEEVLREQLALTGADCLFGADDELCADLQGALSPPGTVKDGAGKILFFTSGTTQRSKAVVLTDETLAASARCGNGLLPLSRDDVLLCMLPIHHVFGFVCGLLWAFSQGACVALGRGARHYADDFAYFRPTAVALVPALLEFTLKNRLLNDELRLVLIGAGDCPPALIDAARATGKRISFGYGLTETSSGVALSLGDDPYAMTVCEGDTVTIAPDGEILIEAPDCMMLGYYHRPEETAAVLRDGVLYTGDLGFVDEKGLLHVTGRKKEMLVLADGTKIFLPEYERAIYGALGRRDLAVILQEGAPVLVIRGREEERDELKRKLAPVMSALPRGHQIRKICFTPSPLPRTATGKIKRWEVSKTYDKS